MATSGQFVGGTGRNVDNKHRGLLAGRGQTTANMAQVISQSGHDDMIHDAVLDYYGRRLATCSSDKTIQIFDVDGDQHRLTETLKG